MYMYLTLSPGSSQRYAIAACLPRFVCVPPPQVAPLITTHLPHTFVFPSGLRTRLRTQRPMDNPRGGRVHGSDHPIKKVSLWYVIVLPTMEPWIVVVAIAIDILWANSSL